MACDSARWEVAEGGASAADLAERYREQAEEWRDMASWAPTAEGRETWLRAAEVLEERSLAARSEPARPVRHWILWEGAPAASSEPVAVLEEPAHDALRDVQADRPVRIADTPYWWFADRIWKASADEGEADVIIAAGLAEEKPAQRRRAS